MSRLVVLAVILSVIVPDGLALGQNPILSNGAIAEKIYLQTDGTVYTKDQSLWFKATVVNAANHRLTALSGVLYVELVNSEKLIVNRKVIKLKKGLGQGFFEFDRSYEAGKYQLRAYTQWNKNFDDRFNFEQYIDLYESTKADTLNVFSDLTLVTRSGKTLLQSEVRLDLIENLPEKPALALNWALGQDTIPAALSDNGTYFLNYELPDTVGRMEVSLTDASGNRFSKTIQVNPDAMDLRFFPESGRMLKGQVSKVAFKAVGPDGLGKKVSGEIVNSAGEMVSRFETNELGMGTFSMFVSESQYKARVKSQVDQDLWLQYELPKVADQGTVMKVLKRDDLYHLDVASNVLQSDSVYLTAAMRGVRYLYVGGKINQDGQLRFKIPTDVFREGIVVFTLRDVNGQTILDRMIFNQSVGKQLEVQVSTDKERYQQRDAAQVFTQVRNDQGQPVKASLSYLVMNKRELGDLHQQRHNIRSYLLLGAELKGYVENPGYYFRPGVDSAEALEALLLTQGWRNYKYQYDVPVPDRFQPEYNLTVSGVVKAPLNKKKIRSGVEISMMTFGENNHSYKNPSDSLGRFYFDINDEYGQRLNVLIQTANARGKNRNYQLQLDENVPPTVRFDPARLLSPEDSVTRILVENHQERKLIDDAYKPADNVTDLGEFVVEDYAITPERKKVLDVHGMPDVVISGEQMRQVEKKYSSGLFSVLFWSFPGEIQILPKILTGDPFDKANVVGANFTLVTIDGVPVELTDYDLIPFLPVSEVKSFEILKAPQNFGRLFYEVYPPDLPLPSFPAIIAIYTYGKKGIYGMKQAPGMFKRSVPVFSPIREFYTPKYTNLTLEDWIKPDYRALIHWEPLAETDDAGRSVTSFYNADRMEEMLIVVEAITEDGSIGYQEHRYEVIKREQRD